MCSTESREEIVERFFVRQIDNCKAEAPFALVTVKQIVMTHGQIKEVARCDAGRVVVVIFRVGGWNFHQGRTVLGCRAQATRVDGSRRGSKHAPAGESCLELLVGSQPRKVHDGAGPVRSIIAIATCARYRTSHQTTIVAPIESDPGATLERLVLQVGCLVKDFVVIDAENASRSLPSRCRANPANLRCEETRCHAGENHKCRKPVSVGDAGADRVSRDFRVVPHDTIGKVSGVAPNMLKS